MMTTPDTNTTTTAAPPPATGTTKAPPVTEPVHTKYAAAVLSLAVLMLTALTSAAAGDFTLTEVLQLVVLFLGGVAAYILPVLPRGWRGGLKTGVAVLAAVLAAVIPLVGGDWSVGAVTTVALAGVNALAVQLGVAVRADGAAALGALGLPPEEEEELAALDVPDSAAIGTAEDGSPLAADDEGLV